MKTSKYDDQCKGKKRFKTQADANMYAIRALKRDKHSFAQLRAYECRKCRCWHLTRQKFDLT